MNTMEYKDVRDDDVRQLRSVLSGAMHPEYGAQPFSQRASQYKKTNGSGRTAICRELQIMRSGS